MPLSGPILVFLCCFYVDLKTDMNCESKVDLTTFRITNNRPKNRIDEASLIL
jgi:hypothetical protein